MTELYLFSAPWCDACQLFKPLLTEVLEDYDNVTLIQLNVEADEALTLGTKYRIMSIPALACDDDVLLGNVNETTLRNWLDDHV